MLYLKESWQSTGYSSLMLSLTRQFSVYFVDVDSGSSIYLMSSLITRVNTCHLCIANTLTLICILHVWTEMFSEHAWLLFCQFSRALHHLQPNYLACCSWLHPSTCSFQKACIVLSKEFYSKHHSSTQILFYDNLRLLCSIKIVSHFILK
jgi:hypothetical protein